MINRRKFLKSSLIAGGVVSTGIIFYAQIPVDEISENLKNSKLKFLSESDVIVLLAIIPVLLQGTELTAKKINTVILNIDNSTAFLSKNSRTELRELFDLLSSKLARAVIVGIWSSWEHATTKEINHFLISWQNSFSDLLQIGYQGLKQLVMANYYSEEENWQQIGYPGPPVLF
jgi:hypothetical protein